MPPNPTTPTHHAAVQSLADARNFPSRFCDISSAAETLASSALLTPPAVDFFDPIAWPLPMVSRFLPQQPLPLFRAVFFLAQGMRSRTVAN